MVEAKKPIAWHGGDMPEKAGTRVEIVLRCGVTNIDTCDMFEWSHDGGDDDIVRYRVVEEEPPLDLDDAVAVVRNGVVLLVGVEEIVSTSFCSNSVNLRISTDRGDFMVTVWKPGEDVC